MVSCVADINHAEFVQTNVISNRFPQEMRLNGFLENVRQTVQHRSYYFGHMHLDQRLFRNQTALYQEVYCLNNGRKVTPEMNCGEPREKGM